jgi:hypothetical protein
MVCQSGTCAGFNQWSEGFLEPPSLWFYHVRRQKDQNAVFCKLIIIVYFKKTIISSYDNTLFSRNREVYQVLHCLKKKKFRMIYLKWF